MDGKGTVPQLVQKMLMRIVRCKDVPMSLATMYVSAAAPFTHSTRKNPRSRVLGSQDSK